MNQLFGLILKRINAVPQEAFLLIIGLISFLFFSAVAYDVSPYLRGPAPYPPEWRWPYLYINTLSKVWFAASLIVVALYLSYFLETQKEKFIHSHQKTILFSLLVFHILFILSIIYFSRAGLGVVFHRIANPGLNGYFTTATEITDIKQFLADYDENIFDFYMHARAHPPGGVLFHFFINSFTKYLSIFFPVLSFLTPARDDVLVLWSSLREYEQMGAFVSAIMIFLLSACSIFWIYKTAQLLYGATAVAIRSIFLYIFIPSVILFSPLIDVLFPLLSISSFYYLLKGLKNNSSLYWFVSGLIMSVGILFGLNMLPVLFMFALFVFFETKKTNKFFIPGYIVYGLGFVLIPILLTLFFNFNYPEVIKKNISEGIAPRSYWNWVLYNPYDFLVFAGIPIFITFIYLIIQKVKKKIEFDSLTSSFAIALITLNILGVSRGEVARLWLPFVPFLVLIITHYITQTLKLKTQHFSVFILFQALTVLIIQAYWVPLW